MKIDRLLGCALLFACRPQMGALDSETTGDGGSAAEEAGTMVGEEGDSDTTGVDEGPCWGFDPACGGDDDGDSGLCTGDGQCDVIDILFVIDNSGTMGEEQKKLAETVPWMVDQLVSLSDADGNPIDPDVNIMVTTTDMGHPLCDPFAPDGYFPARGSPVSTACTDRLQDFTGIGDPPLVYEEACTSACPESIAPGDPFIHFDSDFTNVPGDNVKGALSCLIPQGINGCGYESPLESMLQALNPGADWNEGSKPFLRDGSILVIVLVSDETDCSVAGPEGYAHFTDPMFNEYWEVEPNIGQKTVATSAVCWNSGVACDGPDMNGIYTDCHAEDHGVLYPSSRYIDYLKGELQGEGREVIMLGLLGVPPVTAHNPDPPYEPQAGGIADLVYRQWIEGQFPAGDIPPGDPATAAEKEWQFGIGPGCYGEDGQGGFNGQAIPPVRELEVCQALDQDERVRCCVESICDTDYESLMNCVIGVVGGSGGPGGP